MSHIEVILSFVLFVGFVGAVLLFFNPIEGDRLIDSSLDYTMREVEGNTSVEIDVIGVKLNQPIVPGTVTINIEEVSDEKSVRCEKKNGEILSCRRAGNLVYLNHEGEDFVSLMFNEEFVEGGAGDPPLDESLYDIASQTKEELVSEKRIKSLVSNYESDYLGLIENFNLPDQVDFEFVLEFSEDKVEAKGNIAMGVNVFSDRSRVEVLRESGEMEFADLVVRVA